MTACGIASGAAASGAAASGAAASGAALEPLRKRGLKVGDGAGAGVKPSDAVIVGAGEKGRR